MAEAEYDYIIVGGGSAGCALANRLSADPANRVLVLEAGRKDWKWDVFIHMPAALAYPIGSRFYDWKYESEPEPHMNGRRVYHARGKVLGGSSSINGMIFQRGNPGDYQKWAEQPGMDQWDYAHCLPYFKRMENCLAGEDEWRGGDGPLILERGPATNPLFEAFLEAGPQAGYRRTDDVNGFRQEGFAAFDKNLYRGRRLSAARAYLHPVLDRPNLTLITRAHANKLLFEGNRCVGVEYRRNRRTVEVRAAEVISCGGAFNSPQLLQLSGIGDPDHLKSLGIPVVSALPGVGENMQDHLEVYIQYSCKEPVSMQPYLAKWRAPFIGLQWLFRKGPAATNHFEAGAFLKSNSQEAYPNLMFHFLPIAIRYDGTSPTSDHGYHLGDQEMWGKATNFELSTRVPLLVNAPGMATAGQRCDSVVELVDLYPTLCDLAGLTKPQHLQGSSFAKLLDDPELDEQGFALSQYPRGGAMGRSVRTKEFRYTEWRRIEGGELIHQALYDLRDDEVERRNVADDQSFGDIIVRLSAVLERERDDQTIR